ncbi:MAG: ABC transporter permease [Clostridia bacterium]|nr:ABC transporter permease [Clostridia bacterium]
MLFRKLIRTMWRYKAQFISMVIMIAIGVGVFTGFNMEWYSLERDLEKIWDATGFSDFRIVSEQGFSAEEAEAVRAIDGVDDVTRFLSVNATVKGEGDVLAMTVNTNMDVSGVLLIEGADYDAADGEGMWLSDQYAAKNGVAVGDRLTLAYKHFELSGTVRGLVKSGEYLVCLPDSTQVMPDYNTYGFVYVTPELLKSAFGFELYTQINVRSTLEKSELVRQVDETLGSTTLVMAKEDVVSYAEAMGEVEEGKTMGNILPVLFIAIAILTMVTTMHRLTASEKTQIGTLKALGFKNRRILVHYSSYALMIGLLGTALGIGLGYFLGWYIMNPSGAMGTYLDMADWTLYMPSFCWLVLVLINVFLTVIGFVSVKSMLRGTAADALRPYAPKKMKSLALEKTRLWARLGFGTKWNLRDSLRHRARTGMTLFGIIGCMVLLVGAMGMKDTMDAFVDTFYNKAINYETRVHIDSENASEEAALALVEKYAGDWSAQLGVQITDKALALEIYHIEHDKVRFVDEDMRIVPLTDDGAYICSRIAEDYGLEPGGSFTFSPYGSDGEYRVRVAGVLRSLSESIVMTDAYAESVGIEGRVSVIYTDETDIPADERITGTLSKQSIIDSFDTFMELMNTMVLLLCVAAVVLGIVVLYNLGVMSYVERYREMATLKVLGFKDRKIGSLLIGQNMWLTVLGVLVGLPCGVGVLKYLLNALAAEYELKLVLGPLTYGVSILTTFGVSLLVGLLISRKNKKIDMVEALKGVE